MISPHLTNCFIIFETTLGSPWATMDTGVFNKKYKTHIGQCQKKNRETQSIHQ